jgi:hypothetical protein
MTAGLIMYVIYRFPADYPDKWVLRPWAVAAKGPLPYQERVFDSLEGARKSLPPSLVRLDRHPQDEPQIYEVWL